MAQKKHLEEFRKLKDKTIPTDSYEAFLKKKVIISESYGFEPGPLNPMMKPHQKDVTYWALKGGRRAIFKLFGLGKTFDQLEIATQCIDKEQKPFLIACPLNVIGEFRNDASKFNIPYKITYITDTDEIDNYDLQIYVTNYERIRKGDIDSTKFCGVSFDEASILRNLKTQTTNYVLNYFGKVPYRFVATATPSPNDYIEILNYAVFLGVASRGHILTRFFQRDSKKAGNLKLYPNKEKEFWQWVSTWAVFVSKPSDLGYDDDGYDLPALNVIEYCVNKELKESYTDKDGNLVLFENTNNDLVSVSREKRETINIRVKKCIELVSEIKGQIVIFCHLNPEQDEIEKLLKKIGVTYSSIRGGETEQAKETKLTAWRNNETQVLLSKDTMYGSGVNLQQASELIYVGLNHKFNNFIQGLHRIYRFGQKNVCNVRLIFSSNEYEVLKVLYVKWGKHKNLQKKMIELVKENGLNSELIKSQMERQIFKNSKKVVFNEGVTVYNNDTVVVHADKKEMPDNSVDLYLTSIPFGDHYEYSDNYNDFGHNHGNDKFFEQMDFLTPNMLRCLKPGRIAAIHVKDRIRYSYQNGTSFTTIADFSGQTVAHFQKHGFYLLGKITITTDVVAENNQTYRLGWTEQCKDASKMGVGLPEYVLLFRKAPTSSDNSYGDYPVTKFKGDEKELPQDADIYTKALWQLDAHAYQRSSGDRYLSKEDLKKFDVKRIVAKWKEINQSEIYDFAEHVRICEEMDEMEKLRSTFMTLPVHSNSDYVWTDVNRMNTLNTHQANAKKEKHICPLQFDIVDRLINRYSMKGDVVCDPFNGLGTTSIRALKAGRKAIGMELNPEYFSDSLYYIKSLIYKMNVPTLFDILIDSEDGVQ